MKIHTSDRNRWGLRGPVHTCRIEREWDNARGDVTEVDFRPDGAMLRRWVRNHDGSEWTTTHEYDSLGRLAVVRNMGGSGDVNESVHEYDDAGRLLRVLSDGREEVHYEYDE